VSFVADPAAIEEPTRRMLAYQVELGDFDKAPSTEGLFDKTPYLRVSAPK
jgi:NitT/TauT family transport system substrate-binding protein